MCEEARAAGLCHVARAGGDRDQERGARGRPLDRSGIYIDDEALDSMLENGTYLVPTLVAPLGVLAQRRPVSRSRPAILTKATDVVDIHRESVRRAVAAGVKIAMGTDAGVVPHGTNLEELQLMQGVGMSPTEVLVATTKTAAELMGLERELGTLEPGSAPTSSSWPATRSTSRASRRASSASTKTASSPSKRPPSPRQYLRSARVRWPKWPAASRTSCSSCRRSPASTSSATTTAASSTSGRRNRCARACARTSRRRATAAPRSARSPARVADIETIVTGSEVEALHLEQNLVKRHRPPFNVRLRDDKSFPYIAVTVEDESRG